MSFKAAIFDLDGVIVETVPLHFKAWQKMFNEYGKEFDFKDYKQKVDGIPRLDGARAILTDASDEELQKAAAKKQDYYLEFLEKEGVKVYDTTVELMKELKANNIKIAVISSSKNCSLILKKGDLYKYIDAEINGNDITKGKPDPQIFLIAQERLGVERQECIVFEDAVLGVEAGKKARMVTIGVDRHKDPQRLKKADLIVEDLSEVNFTKLNSMLK